MTIWKDGMLSTAKRKVSVLASLSSPVDLFKLFVFPVAPHEGLDDPDGGKPLLDAAVQVIHRPLLTAVERRHMADNPGQHDSQDGGGDEEDDGEPGAEDEAMPRPMSSMTGLRTSGRSRC